MWYQFRCDNHTEPYLFEVKQAITDDHVADCPICHTSARRVYTPPDHYQPNQLWHRDGSRQDPSEIPIAPTDNNYGWHGF